MMSPTAPRVDLWEEEKDSSRELTERENGLISLGEFRELHEQGPHCADEKAEFLEDLLAKEMEKLSFEEQERAAFDVHGLSSMSMMNGENGVVAPILEDEKLLELGIELQRLANISPSQATTLDNPLAKRRDFRLMFLRCDDYEVKVAAQRILKHFELKKEHFPPECLHRHLERSDLTEEAQHVLDAGLLKTSPIPDAAGRIVVVWSAAMDLPRISQLASFQTTFYFLCNLARLEQAQRQGYNVTILFTGSPSKRVVDRWYSISTKERQRIRAGIPRKIVSAHFCLDTSNTSVITSQVVRLLPLAAQMLCRPSVRSRFRTHTGTTEILQLKLQSYGIIIPKEDWLATSTSAVREAPLPTANNTSSNNAATATTKASIPITPTDRDVLLGRGKHTRNHPGNVRAVQLVDAHRDQYEAGKKFEKTAIAERIVRTIQQEGRFLKLNDATQQWMEVDAQTARNKISHLYRNTRKASQGILK